VIFILVHWHLNGANNDWGGAGVIFVGINLVQPGFLFSGV
jgi:hypothetical protein